MALGGVQKTGRFDRLLFLLDTLLYVFFFSAHPLITLPCCFDSNNEACLFLFAASERARRRIYLSWPWGFAEGDTAPT